MQFLIMPRELKALRLFTSSDESRWGINGVCIELKPGAAPRMIATDGQAIVIMETEAAGNDVTRKERFTIASRHIDILPITRGAPLVIENDGGLVRIQADGFQISGAAIDATFPKYHGVIPPSEDTDHGDVTINTFYASKFEEAARILGVNSTIKLHSKLLPIEISMDKHRFLGLLMPMEVTQSNAFADQIHTEAKVNK